MSISSSLPNTIAKPGVVTSSTRPSNPYAGQMIYETDTFRTLLYDGTGWVIMSEPTQTFTPTWSGFTGGTPTSTGNYHRNDGYCEFQAKLLLGGTPSAVSGLVLTFPIAAVQVEAGDFHVMMTNFGGFRYIGTNDPGTSSCPLYSLITSGTYGNNNGGPTLTVPFTWHTGDYISVLGRYRMTTRYS